MADDNKEKKSIKDLIPFDKLSGLFGGRPWILLIILVAVVLIIVVIAVSSGGKNGNKNATLTNPGMLTAAIVYGDDRYADHDDAGRLVGKEPEAAQALADALGLECKIIEASTVQEAMALLDTAAADVAFGRISPNRNLTGYVTSGEYGGCGLFIVTALHDYTSTLDLMTGYSVGIMDTVKDTAMGIRGYDFISPRDYTDPLIMGGDIRDRAVNMGICSERDALNLVQTYPGELQTQEVAEGPAERYVAVFPLRSGAYAAIFDAVMSQ